MDEKLPNKVDRLFNDSLQKFKSDPSKDVWNKIEEELDEHDRKIAGSFFGWKQYTVAAILLTIGLSVLSKIYLHQEATFNHELVLRGKAGKSSVIPPKTKLPVRDLESKANLRDNDQDKNKGELPVLIADRKQKTIGNATQKTSRPDNITQNIDARNDISLSILNEAQHQMAPAQAVESRSLLLPESQPALPEKVTYKPLTVIHQKTRFKDRLSVTPYFSQEFAGYSLTDNDLTGVNGQEIEERERNVFSASVGFYINYKISKRWIFQSGISYSWSNSNIDSGTSYAVIDNHGNIQYKFNTISGYGYLKPTSSTNPNVGDSVYTAKSYSQLHYLTIPFVLSYHIPLKRFSLLIGAGASFNVLTGAEIETKTYGHGDPEKEYSVNMMGLKKVNYGMLLKLDIEYHINSSMGVNIIPCFKNTLSPINLESAVTAYPYNFGIGVGVTYRF